MSVEPSLAAAVRAKRAHDRLSLRQAGEASGISFSTLGRIERGAAPSPKVCRQIRAWIDGALPTPPRTLRDWFAGHALAGILACPIDRPADTIHGHAEHYSGVAYIYADAMLAARAALSLTKDRQP